MATTRTKLEGIPLSGMKQRIANATKGQFLTSSKKSPKQTKTLNSKANTAYQSKNNSPEGRLSPPKINNEPVYERLSRSRDGIDPY